MENFWQIRNIQPASLVAIQQCIDDAYAFAANASDEKYGRGRGAAAILETGKDYAELPGFEGRTARQIIEALPAGSTILDIGCGYGELGADILCGVNPNVEVYGFDAQQQPGQERLTQVVIGNVDKLSPDLFGGRQFDLIISSALLYHLPDYWGAVLRMSRMLKPGGMLLASTMPRVVRDIGEPVDDAKGLVEEEKPEFFYFRNRNVFDTAGCLVPAGELVKTLNTQNPGFLLAYSLVAGMHIAGSKNVGGQIAGKRVSAQDGLNLSNLFYCLSNTNLGYVVAQTPEQKKELEDAGFMSLESRLL